MESKPYEGSAITRWLRKMPTAVFVVYTAFAAFATYFSMYAFRKPFQATSYDGLSQWGLDLKILLVLSQLIGYTLSKYLGVKICSEVRRKYRFPFMLVLVIAALATLLLFGLLPLKLKWIAMFLNGLPLGMVWGVCVLYLEGRRTTELLLAGLSSSYIISSGVVKDVGRALMRNFEVGEFWMPALTGLCFLPAFLIASWMLNQIPDQTPKDEDERTHRQPMKKEERHRFARYFAVGIVLQLILYVSLTAFRDFRDSYGIEIFHGLGLDEVPNIFTKTESWIALMVVVVLVSLTFFKAKRWGVLPNFIYMILGIVLLGGSTVLFDLGRISGATWMILAGMGGYLAYVANDTILYERLIAHSHWVGTAVFMTYVMDAGGYSGSIALQLYKNFGSGDLSYFRFFHNICYVLTAVGIVILAYNTFYFPIKAHRHVREQEN